MSSSRVVEVAKPANASDKATGGGTSGAGNVDAEREAKRARGMNAARLVTDRWKNATKGLFDLGKPVDTSFSVQDFRGKTYELVSETSQNGMQGIGPQVLADDPKLILDALSGEIDREPYAKVFVEAMSLQSRDRAHMQALGATLDDLMRGGEVKWNTRELLGHYAPLSSDGKKWVAKAPKTALFKAYVEGWECAEHGGMEMTHLVAAERKDAFQRMLAEQGANFRKLSCQPLVGMLERGALGAAPSPDKVAQQKPDGTVAPGTAGTGPDPVEKAAEDLLAKIKDAIENHSTTSHEERSIRRRDLNKLFTEINNADSKVKDKLYAKPALMEQLMLLDPVQMKQIVARLDTVQGLYDSLIEMSPNAKPRAAYQTHAQANWVHESAYPTLEKFLTDRPGKEMAPARMRVLQHEQLKSRFIDHFPEAQRKAIFKLVASGTLAPTLIDKLRDAARAGNAAEAAPALMKVANESNDELVALRDDHIFRKEIENVDKEVGVDGFTVNPYHLCLTFWGLEPLSTKDVTVDERQQEVNPHGKIGSDGKVIYRPLTIEERVELESKLLDPYARRLRSEIAENIVDDDDMKSICQRFERDSADFLRHFQTLGKAPGPMLTEYYNKKYQGHDLRGEVNEYVSDNEMVECERILGFRIDSATVGIINGKVAEHGTPKQTDGKKVYVGLAQALRETYTDKGVPLSQLTSDYAERLSNWMYEVGGAVSPFGFEAPKFPGCDKAELLKSWDDYYATIDKHRGKIAEHTTLAPNQIHPIELVVNAVREKGGDLAKKIQRFFGEKFAGAMKDESAEILKHMGLTAEAAASRAASARKEEMAADPTKGIEQLAKDTYAQKASALFTGISTLPASLDLTAIQPIAESFKSLETHKIEGAPVFAGPLTKSIEERPPRTFKGYYRLEYGIDPRDHVGRILKSHKERGKDVTAAAQLFGVEPVGEIVAPDEELIIDEAHHNVHLVRHNFTVETAKGVARELWNAIHEGTRFNVVITKLYTDFATEEQRLIRIAFRRLSGGLDLQFYIQQKLLQVKNQKSIGDMVVGGGPEVTAIGGEGTRETQGEGFTKKKEISLGESDVNKLETALTAAQHGTVDTYAMMRSAANNRDVSMIMRLADETEQADRAKILADNDLMDKLRQACDAVAWDRVYKTLTNQADLVDRLYQRAGGWGTDEKGMREDVKAHVKRLRKHFDKEIRAEEDVRRKNQQPARSPDQIDEAIKARVKLECQRLMTNISVRRIIEEELSNDELSDVESLILNAGETNTQSDVLRGGKEADTIIAGIRSTPPQERARLRADAAYLEKLALRLTNPDDYRQAMDALMSDRAGEDKLEKVDAHATKKEPREMLRDLVDLDAGELKRLQADPDMQAKLLAAFDDPDQRALARKILTTKLQVPDPKAPPDKQQEQADAIRIKFLVENAKHRLRVPLTDELGWPTMLEQCIEVYKMELEKRVWTQDESGQNVLGAYDKNESLADRSHRENTAAAIRRGIWRDVKDSVVKWAHVAEKDKPRRTLSEVWTAQAMIDVVEKAVLHLRDPSTERILNNLGATVDQAMLTGNPISPTETRKVELNDNHAELLVAIRGASDQVLVDEWSNVKLPSLTGGPSLADTYVEYQHAKKAAKQQPADPAMVRSGADEELTKKKLGFMNYVLDVSTNFEEIVLPNVGSSDERTLTRDNNGGPNRLRDRDNKKYNELLDAARERIVNLTKRDGRFLVAKAIKLENEDFDLIDSPNRDAITAFQYRDSKFLRSRGTKAGSGWAADDEAQVVDQRMMQYGHEVAEAQTNKDGGRGIITKDEAGKLEERGAEFDRALQAFKDAKAKVAFWLSMIVGVLVTAVLTVLTGGLATGPLAALFFTTAIAGVSAGAKALVNEAVLAEDYDLKDEGVQMIGKEMLTAFITAGTTMIAQKMVAGVAGMTSLGRQARAAQQVMRQPPPMWKSFLTEASEEVISETMSGTIDAALIAIDPVHWMHGVAEGRDRALPAAWTQLKNAPMQGLKGGITSMLTAGAMRLPGKKKQQLQDLVKDAGPKGKVNIKENFKKVFGGNTERVIATFVEWSVDKIGKGKIDIEAVPGELLEGFLQEVSETSMETHTGTAHEKTRGARAEAELKRNEGRLTDQEKTDFADMHAKAGPTDPYITIQEYVRIRATMAGDAVYAWSQRNPGKTLTEAQVKAYVMWCREATDATTFQTRVHTDPDLVEAVQQAKDKPADHAKTEAGKKAGSQTDAADATKTPSVVEVQTVSSVDEGYAIMRRLVGGDATAVQGSVEGRADAVEWGLGRKTDGSIVILRGKSGEVDFDQIPGIVALAHSHPAVLDGKPRDLAAATKNPAGVHIGELMNDANQNDLVKFLPSTGDLGYFADNTISSHVVFTPYVHMGDGRIGNPNGAVSPDQRIEIVVQNSHLVGRSSIQKHQGAYSATIVIRTGDGQVLWTGPMYAVKIAGDGFKADQPSLAPNLIDMGQMPEPRHDEDSKSEAGTESDADVLGKYATPKSKAAKQKQKVNAGEGTKGDPQAPGNVKRPASAAEVFAGQTPQVGEVWTFQSASGNHYVGRFQGVDQNGHIVVETHEGIGRLDPTRLNSARQGVSVPALHGYGPTDRITLYSVRNNPRTGVILGYDEQGNVRFQTDQGELQVLFPSELNLRRVERAPERKAPAQQQQQAPQANQQHHQQHQHAAQQAQQQVQVQAAPKTAADVFAGDTPQIGEFITLKSGSGKYYRGYYQGVDEGGRILLRNEQGGIEGYNAPRLLSARRGNSIRELHDYGPNDRITIYSVNGTPRTGVVLGYDGDGNVIFQRDSGQREVLRAEALNYGRTERAPAQQQQGKQQPAVSDAHVGDPRVGVAVHVGEDAAAHIALATQLGVMPSEVVSVGGATFKVGKLFDIGDGRVAALFEVEVNGQRYMRVAYRSNSQGGFRVLPARNQGVPYVPGYDKAIGEHAIMVPNEVEELLSRNLVADKVRRDLTQEQADKVFEGAVPINRSMQDWANFQNSPDHIKHHVTEQKILGEAKDTLRTANGGEMAVPNQVAIADQAHRPNFKNLVRTYSTSTAVAGDVTAMVYRSHDGSLEYVLYRDATGRVWFKSVSKVDSEITAQGVRAVAVDADALCTPLWEYAKQVPHGYAGARHPTQPNYVDAWKYLSQMPEIQAYYAETGQRMPGAPGNVDAANRPTQPMQAVVDPTTQQTETRAADPAIAAQQAVQQAPVLPTFRDINADLAGLAQLSGLPDAVIGPHQASRVPAAVRALSDADYQQFRALHDSLTNPAARGFLFKALAAHNSIADLQWLASEMASKDDAWLIDALTLGDPRSAGVGVQQQWSMSCNASTTITLRGNYDPVFALKVRYSNPNINRVDPNNPLAWNNHLASLEAQLLQSQYQGASHPELWGSAGIAAPMSAGATRGRWADDILSRQADVTGMTYGTQKDPSGDQALATIDRAVSQGMQVPVVVGDYFGAYTHYVLCMSRRVGAAGFEYQFHNTGDGTTTWVTAAQLANGQLPLNGGRMITAIEVPTATPMPAEATTTQPTLVDPTAQAQPPHGVPTASPSSITRPMAAVTVEDAPVIATTAVAVVNEQVAPTSLAATLQPSGQTSPDAKGEQKGPEQAMGVPPAVANTVQMIVHGRAHHAAQQLQAMEAQAAMGMAQATAGVQAKTDDKAQTPGTKHDPAYEAFKQSWQGKPADIAAFRAFFDVGYEDAMDKVRRAMKNPQVVALLGHVPEDELAAIVLYTQTFYVEMNSALRNRDKDAMKDFGDGIKLADKGLAKMPTHQGWVHRGVESLPADVLAKYVPGVVVTEEAFTSTSQAEDSAFTGQVKFKIKSKTGRDVQALSRVEKEKEVLFRPGTKFLVTDKERDGDAIVITMEEVTEGPGGAPGGPGGIDNDPTKRKTTVEPANTELKLDKTVDLPADAKHGDEQATAKQAVEKKDGWQKSAEQADALEAAKQGSASKEQRDVLARELKRQVPDLALASAVHKGTAKSVVALVFPGNGEMGIKTMNDEVLGQRLNDELIRERDGVVQKVFAKHKLEIVDQNYKTTTVVTELSAEKLGDVLKKALADIDTEMKRVMHEQLEAGLTHWQGELAKASQKPGGSADAQAAQKHIKNIKALQESIAAKNKFTYDMQIGASELKEGSTDYKDILSAEMDATKAALMARDTEGKGVDPQDSRARVYSADAFKEYCEETIALRSQLEGKQLPLNGEHRDVIKDGAIDKDLLRAVRKDKIDPEALKGDQVITLELLQRYFKRVNALDYFAPFKGTEVESQGMKVDRARELLRELESDRPISAEIAAELDQLLKSNVAQSGTASEAKFYNKAAKLEQRTVLNADIKDMGVDLWFGFEEKMEAVADGTMDSREASFTAADNIVETKRGAVKDFKEYYESVLNKAKAAARARNDRKLIDALDKETEPLVMLGGDEITVSLSGALDELGLIPEIVENLAKIANARVAVTDSGRGNGAEGHKAAMKKADAGHGLLKKYEQLGQILDGRSKAMEGRRRENALAVKARIDNLYTAEHAGNTVLRCSDGKSISTLRNKIAIALGKDGRGIVAGILDKEEPTEDSHDE
jgi:hypothetical protein